MTAAAEVMTFTNRSESATHRASAWQEAAWDYFDQIGELKFAFNLMAQVVSRALLYPAVIVDNAEVPIGFEQYLDSMQEASGGEIPIETNDALKTADQLLAELIDSGQAEILKRLTLNMSIPGECYLLNVKDKWIIASNTEFTPGSTPFLNQHRNAQRKQALPSTTYAARIWRAHPRWHHEPESSMLGVLDSCEKIILFDQVMRALSRSRLNAGVIAIPNGLTPITEGMDLNTALSQITVGPVESEVAAASVTPLILQGPSDMVDKIKWVELGRKIDADFLAAYDSALDRLLAGVDLPKELVSGLSNTKYANALVIDDSLYKAHIEPMLLLICDSLTNAYLRPRLLKEGVPEKLVNQMVIWYNPSEIVTRPDQSSAASEGYNNYLLSGKTWRAARGFSEHDAPSPEELTLRMALEKSQVPPEMASVLIESINPQFFAKAREDAQAEAGVPDDLANMLDGGGEELDATDATAGMEGDEIPAGSTLPPRELPESEQQQEPLP